LSYHLYHTLGFVLKSFPRGEGNQSFALFTRELGLVQASATSVREERSKLRYGLQECSLSELTLVRGKESWRITGASLLESVCHTFSSSPVHLQMFARVFRLLLRLLAGEEKNERLFDTLVEACTYAGERHAQNAKAHADIEVVLVLRILYLLGYLAPRNEFRTVLSDSSKWSDSLLSDTRMFRTLALRDINQSLKASQL
jgi:DNA repair protein RecO